MARASELMSCTSALVSVMRGEPTYADYNQVSAMVRDAIEALHLPSDFIVSGHKVVLKPNWVKEHDERNPGPDSWMHVVTHPAIIEAVCGWVASKLVNAGSIVVCDAPQTDSSFRRLTNYCQLDEMLGRLRKNYPGISIQILDLRPEEWHAVDGITVSKTKLEGDPMGATRVELNGDSEFLNFSGLGRLYGASFDMAETNSMHQGEVHQYLLCRTPMEADVFINLPKLKTHKKVGITCALKNLVGINANKNWLPHHTEGTPDQGGDQFPLSTTCSKLEHSWMGTAKRLAKSSPLVSRILVPLKKLGRLVFGDTQRVVRSGNWHGNDTCWRMVLDLNKCLFHFNGEGKPRNYPLKYLAVVDGIVGGEGNGPMAPDPVASGVIIAGTSPIAVDCTAAMIMGFDWKKIRMLKQVFEVSKRKILNFKCEDIRVVSNRSCWNGPLEGIEEHFHFRPHFGWVGAIESATKPGKGTGS